MIVNITLYKTTSLAGTTESFVGVATCPNDHKLVMASVSIEDTLFKLGQCIENYIYGVK